MGRLHEAALTTPSPVQPVNESPALLLLAEENRGSQASTRDTSVRRHVNMGKYRLRSSVRLVECSFMSPRGFTQQKLL